MQLKSIRIAKSNNNAHYQHKTPQPHSLIQHPGIQHGVTDKNQDIFPSVSFFLKKNWKFP